MSTIRERKLVLAAIEALRGLNFYELNLEGNLSLEHDAREHLYNALKRYQRRSDRRDGLIRDRVGRVLKEYEEDEEEHDAQ